MGRVIVLNGTSSAGKSSLARTIQAIADDDWLHVSLDKFIGMLAAGTERTPDWFVVDETVDDTGAPSVAMTNGPRGHLLMEAMRTFIADAAAKGLDIIADDVCTADEVADYRERLTGQTLTIVKVEVPLDVLEQRERNRGDRMIGLARNQFCRIHKGVEYDLVVRNGDGMLEATAREVLAAAA